MKARPYAFTLVELLVVVAVLAILVGLLLPSISMSWRKAQAVRCRAQLQQIGQAISMYAEANRGHVVPFDGHWPSGFSRPWREVLFGTKDVPLVICPTGLGIEQQSYQLNVELLIFSTKLGSRLPYGGPTSEIVVAAENLPRTEYEFSHSLAPGLGYDRWRHGPGIGSNYLYLDFHVSGEEPTAPPGKDFVDPFRIW